ncbi:hypothetical protein DINM_001067 [Dirofilaria immitis]|nr:hypothetical protein [Dirofilaria immitis]
MNLKCEFDKSKLKDSWKNPKSELLLSSYEKQNVKSKQKLRNLEKQVAEIGEEQAKRTNERSAGQSQEMEILTKKNNEAAEEHPTIYPTTLKKTDSDEISRGNDLLEDDTVLFIVFLMIYFMLVIG